MEFTDFFLKNQNNIFTIGHIYIKINYREENGVTIRTIPAIHIFDGPISFIVEFFCKFCMIF